MAANDYAAYLARGFKAVSPQVVPLPIGFGECSFFKAGNNRLLRFAVTPEPVPTSELESTKISLGSRQIGKTSIAALANRRFWVKRGADYAEFSVIFDNRQDLTTPDLTAPVLRIPYGDTTEQFFYHPAVGLDTPFPTPMSDSFLATMAAASDLQKRKIVVAGAAAPLGSVIIQTMPGDASSIRTGYIDGPEAYGLPLNYGQGFPEGFMWSKNSASRRYIPGLNSVEFKMTWTYAGVDLVRDDLARLNAWRTAVLGVEASNPAGRSQFTHPGVSSAWPMRGLYMHGVHPMIKRFDVKDGAITGLHVAVEGRDFVSYIRESASMADASLRPQILAAATQLEGTIGAKHLRGFISLAGKIGPFDVYECAAIKAARADGATGSEIDEADVSGKRADVWRREGLALSPADAMMWPSAEESTNAFVTRAYRVGGEVVFARDIGAVQGTVYLDTPDIGYSPDPSTWTSAEAMLASCREKHPTVTFDSSKSLMEANSSLRMQQCWETDLPYAWWQSMGTRGLSGFFASLSQAILVPTVA